MSRVYGVILAGGGGTRLGGLRKADIRIGGRRLLDRTLGAFAGQVDELFVATGRFKLDLPDSIKLISDQGGLGPLVGMRAAAETIRAEDTDLLVFAAVDAPFLPRECVFRLVASACETGAAYAAYGDAFYPTNSAWRVKTLKAALAQHASNVGPKLLLQGVGATRLDWSDRAQHDPFANLNTLADLIALQRRALSLAQSAGLRGV